MLLHVLRRALHPVQHLTLLCKKQPVSSIECMQTTLAYPQVTHSPWCMHMQCSLPHCVEVALLDGITPSVLHTQELTEEEDEKKAPQAKGEPAAADKRREAQRLKDEGNEAVKRSDLTAAHELYSAALQLATKDQKAVRYIHWGFEVAKVDRNHDMCSLRRRNRRAPRANATGSCIVECFREFRCLQIGIAVA